MKELANSPLELYEKAYRLHYDEGRVPDACRIYKEIINEFPDSNECGYAVIQLEKILAQKVSGRINVSSRWVGLLAVISIVVSVFCLVEIIFLNSASLKKISARVSSASLMSRAVGKMAMGKDRDALELLADAKSATQNKDIAPYLLSADIFMKKQQYARAMAEYDAVRKLPGGETIAKDEMVKVKADEENAAHRPAAEKIIEDTSSIQRSVESIESLRPEPAPQPAREIRPKIRKEAAPARSVRPKRTGQGRADSISFF
jgi:tetratricopeptide (TPR) repeat protein